uniref:Uncharacterized protein n=1 Tax=Avena sativa TaxID=4498 RepID=A0ACD5ZB83_AVESA
MRDGLVVRDRPFEEEDSTLHACDLRRRGPRAERRPVVCLNPYGRRYTFHASCDGLLLLFSCDFYICNPATRECASLPGMAGSAGVAGMYLHSASGEYRVLHGRWKKTGDAQTRPATYYYVLAVGSSEAPRPVVRSSSGMEAAVLAAGMEHDQTECCPTAPVMLHGCLHWDPGSWRWDRIVVFDTAQETFRSMSSPAPAAASLLEMDATLGISSCDASDGTVRIWLLQDYGSEAWSLSFRIQLPTMEKTVVAQVTSLNGETLVCYSDGVFASSSALFRCDNRGGLLKEFRWRTLEPTITGHWFKESLLRHAFFQTQDGVGLQPCVFQDL